MHMLRALLYQTLILLNRKFELRFPIAQKKTTNSHIKRFVELETYHRQHRTVDYYAQQLHITSGHLNSIVKDYFAISAKAYILNESILEAKRLLTYKDLSIEQITDYLNYQSTTYFIRIFKEHTNKTPLNFRRPGNPEKCHLFLDCYSCI